MKAQNLNFEATSVLVGAGVPVKRPAQPTPIPLPDHLADLAVEALIDEADLSPNPAWSTAAATALTTT